MRSLAQLVQDAVWPYDCPARRQARGILLTIVGTWAMIIVGPALCAWVLAVRGS